MARRLVSVCCGLVVSAALSAPVLAGVVHVPGDAPTIQQAIAIAANGDTVLVGPGTYHERIDFLGKRLSVQGVEGSNATTIDADNAGSVVTVASGEPVGTQLRGFTLMRGSGTSVQISPGTTYRVGAGVYVDNGSKLAVSDCRIVDNHANTIPDLSRGGGVFVRQAQASFEKCRITANTAAVGSAAYTADGLLELTQCEVSGNTAGHAADATVQGAQLTDCLVRDNVGSGYSGAAAAGCAFLDNTGDGMRVIEDTVQPITVSGCEFGGNGLEGLRLVSFGALAGADWSVTSCVFRGGDGLMAFGSEIGLGESHTLRLVNDTFDGSTIFFDTFPFPAELLATNCILRDASWSAWSVAFDHCDANPLQPGAGNIDADPQWVDPANGDYHLQPGSPCINAGSPLSPPDPDGSPADMGALPYDPWTDLGGGVAGSAGLPLLEGTGSLIGGSSLTLSFSGAPAFQPTLLVVGVSQLGAPFKGGTLWPSADIVAPIGAAANGSWTLPATWPAGLPAAASVWLQVWFPDAGAPQGFAASGGLRATTP